MEISTKEKILKISHKLFADKGYNGVSIREIAKACDVNIASINYHFENKENLYVQTIAASMENLWQSIEVLYKENEDKPVEVFVLSIYKHFLKNSEDLRTAFKLVISNTFQNEAIEEQIKKNNGPPGGEFIHKALLKEVGNASDEDLAWGVRVIFTQILHKSLTMCNKAICESLADIGLSELTIENDIKRLVNLVIKEIKA